MMQRALSAREDLEEAHTTRAVEACVGHGELCAGLPAETRQEVAAFLLRSGRLEFRRVAPGQTVVAEGEPAHDFYVIRTPYCMDGCPVDAIHRREGRLEVVVEGHCIGCGLCATSCPYGAIQMVARPQPGAAGAWKAPPRRAVNCDLCEGETPYCVEACPHEAAFRLDGPALLDEVVARARRADRC
jgi:Fe-S-cluster-containing hydrogenase component 2